LPLGNLPYRAVVPTLCGAGDSVFELRCDRHQQRVSPTNWMMDAVTVWCSGAVVLWCFAFVRARARGIAIGQSSLYASESDQSDLRTNQFDYSIRKQTRGMAGHLTQPPTNHSERITHQPSWAGRDNTVCICIWTVIVVVVPTLSITPSSPPSPSTPPRPDTLPSTR
jgi:hypothetical protein